MSELTLKIEVATPDNVAPFGILVAAREGVKQFTAWPGTTVYGGLPIRVDDGAELLVVLTAKREFPGKVGLIERHFKHTQTYLPFNGKPFVMVLGMASVGDAPDYGQLRAFLFDQASGIALHENCWHEFPRALEDDTQFAVILRHESHLNTLETPAYPMEALGPDLERRNTGARTTLYVSF